jgi:pyrroline-5-carboxylate reductase
LLAIDGESPAVLRQKVTSPGGTTEAALRVLADGKFGTLLANAIEKACERSRELSK